MGLLDHQARFIHNIMNRKIIETALVSGTGAGKTYVGVLTCAMLAMKYPGIKGIIGSVSLSVIASSVLDCLKEVWDGLGMKYKIVSRPVDPHIMVGNGTKIYIKTEKTYQLGVTAGWVYIDEAAYTSPDFLNKSLLRLRQKGGPGVAFYTTTPNGFNHFKKRFVDDMSSVNSDGARRVMINASSYANTYNDARYFDILGTMSGDVMKQEIYGLFIQASGDVFRSSKCKFKRSLLSEMYIDISIDPGFRFPAVVFSADFGNTYAPKIVIFDYIAVRDRINDDLFELVKEKLDMYMVRYGVAGINKVTIDPSSSAKNPTSDNSIFLDWLDKIESLGLGGDCIYSRLKQLIGIFNGINIVNRFFRMKMLLIADDIDIINSDNGYYQTFIGSVDGIKWAKDGSSTYGKGEEVDQRDHLCDAKRYMVMFGYSDFALDADMWADVSKHNKPVAGIVEY